ncbi:ABC transporter ATP-binding protein [bacterium]|nr:ABC transporter ATP-binding protein [bacterium]
MIQLQGISKVYQTGKVSFEALKGVDVTIHEGESVAITGPSGSGKSTLMHIIGLLDKPTQGTYHLDDKDVSQLKANQLAKIRNEKIGFVFQSFHLLSGARAWENVALPLIYGGVKGASRKERAIDSLKEVGLGPWALHKSNELSGGQMQRVAVARALVSKPRLLLADEPTGNLDSKTSAEILKLLDDQRADGTTLIIVTHDHEVADQCGRTIHLLDGRVV